MAAGEGLRGRFLEGLAAERLLRAGLNSLTIARMGYTICLVALYTFRGSSYLVFDGGGVPEDFDEDDDPLEELELELLELESELNFLRCHISVNLS